MNREVDVSAVARLLADRSRCRMLFALTDGRALPAGRLATEAGVAPSTASSHLAGLLAAGFVVTAPAPPRHGRHRFYRLAGPEVAEVLESLAAIAPPQPVRSLREGTRAEALRAARTCYDHLAGRLGVELLDSLVAREHLIPADAGYNVTAVGANMLAAIDIDIAALRARKRPLIRTCIDWSEQRPHLAGSLGAALVTQMLDRGWLRRSPLSRAVHLTDKGESELYERFGLHVYAHDRPRAQAV